MSMAYNRTLETVGLVGILVFSLQGHGQSAGLLEAVRNNDPKAVDSFLQKGADPNAYDDDSDNVLINSAIYASVDCMRLLLQHKADPNLTNRYGHTALISICLVLQASRLPT
jgi:ankyrin repeat protein